MNTSPTHDLMERSAASLTGSPVAALNVNSLSATIHHRQPRELGFLVILIAGCAILGCGSRTTSKSGLTPHELKTDVDRLSLARFSLDGKQLAVGGANGEVLIWHDLNDPPKKLESSRSSPLISLTWSPDGLLAVTDLGRGFAGWQFKKSEPHAVEFPELPTPAVCLAFRPNADAMELVLGMRDGSLIFVDARGSKQIKPDHRGAVKQAVFSPDGKWLITAGADGQLIWRDASTRSAEQPVKAHDTEIARLLWSADGKQLISGDWNGMIKIWDTTTRKSQREFNQPEAVSGLGWVRTELVSASWDGSLRGWDVASGRCLQTIATGQPIHDMAADPRTPRVATVSLDRSVRVWDWPENSP